MRTPTKVEVWQPEHPLVVFLVPGEGAQGYSAVMNQLTVRVLQDLNRPPDDVELIGIVAPTPSHGAEGIYFLEEMGIDPRSIILLALWGDTAESVGFEDYVSPECGVGFIALPKSGTVLPAVRMPSIEGEWWMDPAHQDHAANAYANMIRHGRMRPDNSDHTVFVADPAIWN